MKDIYLGEHFNGKKFIGTFYEQKINKKSTWLENWKDYDNSFNNWINQIKYNIKDTMKAYFCYRHTLF